MLVRATLFTISLLFIFQTATAQFTLGGDLLTRAQVRHGARTLPEPGDEAAIFLSQRSRLTANYLHQNDFRIYFAFQDVRVWGSQSPENVGSTLNANEAWVEFYPNNHWTVKAGRQGLSYDDGYLFAAPNWREAGRSHDALRVQYRHDSTFEAHLGGAFNAAGASVFAIPYPVAESYRNLQWFWTRKQLTPHFHLGSMVMRRALETNLTSYTGGGEVGFQKAPWEARLVGYYQGGTHSANITNSAWFGAARAEYQGERFGFATWIHYLSGSALEDFTGGGGLHSYEFLYGFKHQYFGTMDYFYSTTFDPPMGLRTVMLRGDWKPLDNLTLRTDVHLFSSDQEIIDFTIPPGESLPLYLGTEVDLSFTYRWKPEVEFQGGYSQMFASETLPVLLGRGSTQEPAYWLWLQVHLTPTFFTSAK